MLAAKSALAGIGGHRSESRDMRSHPFQDCSSQIGHAKSQDSPGKQEWTSPDGCVGCESRCEGLGHISTRLLLRIGTHSVPRQLTDTCIKNGGDHFLQEIASKDFVGEMTNLIKAPVSRLRAWFLTIS